MNKLNIESEFTIWKVGWQLVWGGWGGRLVKVQTHVNRKGGHLCKMFHFCTSHHVIIVNVIRMNVPDPKYQITFVFYCSFTPIAFSLRAASLLLDPLHPGETAQTLSTCFSVSLPLLLVSPPNSDLTLPNLTHPDS